MSAVKLCYVLALLLLCQETVLQVSQVAGLFMGAGVIELVSTESVRIEEGRSVFVRIFVLRIRVLVQFLKFTVLKLAQLDCGFNFIGAQNLSVAR